MNHLNIGRFDMTLQHIRYFTDSQLWTYLSIHFQFSSMQLDDSIIKTIEIAPDQELKEAKNLIQRIRRRDLYQVLIYLFLFVVGEDEIQLFNSLLPNVVGMIMKFLLQIFSICTIFLLISWLSQATYPLIFWQFCNEYAVPRDKLEHFKNVTSKDIICSQVKYSFHLLCVYFCGLHVVLIKFIQTEFFRGDIKRRWCCCEQCQDWSDPWET